MDENKIVDELEQESLKELSTLEETDNEKNEKVIDDAKTKLDDIFTNVRELLKDVTDPEKVKVILSSAKEEAKNTLTSTKDRVIEVSESDKFKETISAGKEFLSGTTSLIVDGFQYGKEVLRKNDSLRNIIDKTDEKVDEIRSNDSVIKAVDTAEELTSKATDAVFKGLKKIFNKGEE